MPGGQQRAPLLKSFVQKFCQESSHGERVRNGRIVAVGLLTQRNLDALGPTFTQVWPVDETPCFHQLLQAIDEADRQLRRDRDKKERLAGSTRAEAASSAWPQ